MDNREVDNFCRKFEAEVSRSNRKFRRIKRVGPFSYYDLDSKLANMSYLPFEEEPMIEILLPQDKFRHLIEMEEWLHKLEREHDGIKKFVAEHNREAYIRSKDVRIAKAYEKYKMLLRLVESEYYD